MLRSLARSILDFCLPRECPACRTGYEGENSICPACDDELKQLVVAPRCGRCATPAVMPSAPCAHCGGGGLRPFRRVVCLGVLNDPLKQLIHRAKYTGRWDIAERLGYQLAQQVDSRTLLATADAIVPVPLHFHRQRQRGFNQAEVIARAISPRRRMVKRAAERLRATETQTQLHSRAQRLENLKDAFVLTDPAAVAGMNVIVVDDVLTSGATLVSLARTLQSAKPASLTAMVLAVADPKGRAFEVI